MPKMPFKDPVSAIQEAMEIHAEAKAQEAGAAVSVVVACLIDTLRQTGKMDQADVELFIAKLDAAMVKGQESPEPSKVVSRVGMMLGRYLTKRSAN